MKTKNELWLWASMIVSSLAIGCGSSSTGGSGEGNLSVVLEAEETIVAGIDSGTGEENILDGFDITFSKYIVSIGNVAMSQLSGANPQSSPDVVIAEFTSLGSFPELTSFNGIPTGQYTKFGFETPAPEADVVNLNQVDEADFDAMIANGWSYIIEGTITDVETEESKAFLIEADVPTVYSDCAVDDMEPGVNVTSNSSVDVTLHGDHIVFNGFPEEEAQVMRLAQWLWDIEDDGDGVLTQADFEAATNVEELFPAPTYTLTGGPIEPIENAWDFIRAQLGTQGHIRGEGECEWSDI
jgi:hypothetical protein